MTAAAADYYFANDVSQTVICMFYPDERNPLPSLRTSGCLVLCTLILVACVVPLLLVNAAQSALENLHLSPGAAMLVLFATVLGSPINLPLVRYPLPNEVEVPVLHPLAGTPGYPQYRRLRQEMLVAVNVGGCIVPLLLAVWLLRHIVAGPPAVLTTLLAGVVLNTAVCWYFARPVRGFGIALPLFIPAAVALTVTWAGLGRDAALEDFLAPVAFISGISGPLFGADLLHWKDFQKVSAGVVSIGGAGTWDGIVVAGLLSALLA